MIARLALAAAAVGLMALSCPDETRWAIESEIMRSLEATRTEDIDAYMKGVPADLLVRHDDGSIMNAEQLRADVLQQWSVIERTIAIETTIDRMEVNPDRSVTVWTSSRWERVMMGRDGVSRHNVVTTQKHREVWKRRGARWFNYEIEELGGQTWIDGTLQS